MISAPWYNGVDGSLHSGSFYNRTLAHCGAGGGSRPLHHKRHWRPSALPLFAFPSNDDGSTQEMLKGESSLEHASMIDSSLPAWQERFREFEEMF